MTRDGGVTSTTSTEEAVDGKENSDGGASFLSLFAFTTKRHFPVLFSAIILTIVAGAIKPTIAIFLGHIFDDLSSFGAGDATQSALLRNVSRWCIALSGLGVATLLVNGAFFSLWLVFGEMQARSVRDKAFSGMLEKEMEWYDLRADGIGSLLVRIQTYVDHRFDLTATNNT
jgi:ATP-binding cassette subfamily B (MDR/TAP) protein 1